MKTIKIEDDVWLWLMDHRTASEKTISSVIKKLIDEKEQKKE